jgi:hypothetical protein
MRFYDREKEIALIKHALSSDYCLFVIYGRRRIGKTRLVREALKGTPYIDIFVPRKRLKPALESFRRQLEESEGFSPQFGTVDDFLNYLLLKTDKPVFFDEIANFRFIDDSAFSTLQQLIDANKEKRNIRLLCTGSYVGLMKKVFTDRKEPLFGRGTSVIELNPLPVSVAIRSLLDKGFSFEDAVGVWCVCGGVPRYLEYAEGRNLEDYIEKAFSPGSFLVPEGETLLIQEFGRKWESYFAILEAMGSGVTRPSEIAQNAGMNNLALPKYLGALEKIGIIERNFPVSRKEKYIRYRIKDNFLNYWFRFIYPDYDELKSGYEKKIDSGLLSSHVGRMVERFIVSLIREKKTIECESIGSWWNRKGDEIDVVCKGKTGVVFMEIKWSKGKTERKEIERLIEKSRLVEGVANMKKKYIIVSRAPLTPSAQEFVQQEGIEHWDIDKIRNLTLGE